MAEPELKSRTKSYALRIIKLFKSLPKTVEAQIIGKQILRSGTSVGAQYREACRSRSTAGTARPCSSVTNATTFVIRTPTLYPHVSGEAVVEQAQTKFGGVTQEGT